MDGIVVHKHLGVHYDVKAVEGDTPSKVEEGGGQGQAVTGSQCLYHGFK